MSESDPERFALSIVGALFFAMGTILVYINFEMLDMFEITIASIKAYILGSVIGLVGEMDEVKDKDIWFIIGFGVISIVSAFLLYSTQGIGAHLIYFVVGVLFSYTGSGAQAVGSGKQFVYACCASGLLIFLFAIVARAYPILIPQVIVLSFFGVLIILGIARSINPS